MCPILSYQNIAALTPVYAGGVQIVSVEVAISSGVLKFSVDLLRLFQCWFKQYLVVVVGGGGDFLGG